MEETAKCEAGTKIRSIRLRAEIATQVEMSRRTGIAQCIISDLERGRRQLNPTWAKLIAEAVEELLSKRSEVSSKIKETLSSKLATYYMVLDGKLPNVTGGAVPFIDVSGNQ